MNTRLARHLSALIFLAAAAFAANAENLDSKSPQILTLVNQQLDIGVEIAYSPAQRELGLMHRTSLGENRGMLFVHPVAEPLKVWMKNTLLPLDVLFLTEDGSIAAMLENLPPCRSDPCPIYDSVEPAKFMLELNAGFIGKHGLKIGEPVSLPAIRPIAY